MDGAGPVRVYAQSVGRVMKEAYGLPDCTWIMVTMDDGTAITVGANWNLPPEGPGFSSATVEVVATAGAMFIDDSHRDLLLTTVDGGLVRPLSSMPGESVGQLFQGPMAAETNHFIECVARDLGWRPAVRRRCGRRSPSGRGPPPSARARPSLRPPPARTVPAAAPRDGWPARPAASRWRPRWRRAAAAPPGRRGWIVGSTD